MAYGKKPTKKSSEAYEKFKADLKAGNIGCCYIFHGEESYLREHYLEQLRKLLTDELTESFNFHKLTNETFDIRSFAEAVENLPMMAEHTLVWVDDVDIFDIIAMVGYGVDARLKAERVDNVKESNLYTTLTEQQKSVVDKLLDIYIQNDCLAIETIDTLNLPNFSELGGLIPCARIMGGKGKYLQFIKELINKIYEE